MADVMGHWLLLLALGLSLATLGWVVYQQQRTALFMRERVEIERQLLDHARTDFLTGLYNRAGFDETFVREVARAQRHERPLALILLDLDNLKDINDRLGHPAGDEALRLVGLVLRESLRITDVAARYGGDEFVVILPETDLEGACAVMDKIDQSMREATARLGLTVAVTVSMGAAEGHDGQALLRAADAAMYRSKRASRLPA